MTIKSLKRLYASSYGLIGMHMFSSKD